MIFENKFFLHKFFSVGLISFYKSLSMIESWGRLVPSLIDDPAGSMAEV